LVINHKSVVSQAVAVAFVLLIALISGSGCSWFRGGDDVAAREGIQPVYDTKTGRLQLLKYDSNHNGTPDTFSYMDGVRVLRIEIDSDEDGKIDRWEYYDAGQRLVKVGFSRAADGVVDAWSYARPDGSIEKLDLSSKRDGTIDRTEYYERQGAEDVLVRAEEDGDADGAIDKWETYDGGRLASVAFDTTKSGKPDRRLVYNADGSVTVEVDPDEDGTFTPAP
jgi:hypothetical protein